MVGSSDISDLQKFMYLQNCLSGDALRKISIYNVSEENFKSAWQLLLEAYDKKRILMVKHLDAILNIKHVHESTHKNLSSLIDEMRQHINMLATLEIVPDEHLLIRILERALPADIRSKWEETLALDKIPNLKQLYTFISETAFRLFTIEQSVEDQPETDKGYKRSLQEKSVNNNNKKPRVENHARVLATNVTKNCLACNKDKHPLYRCSVFRHANLQQRWEIVKKAGVCRNCLVKHESECKYFRCKKCSDFHNALLHSDFPHSDNESFQGEQTL